jgi:uncharacterized protein (DUF2141 family)
MFDTEKFAIPCTAVLIAVLAACTGGPSAVKSTESRPAGAGSIEVSIQGVTSAKGTIWGSVYIAPEGFPNDKELAYTYASAHAVEAREGMLQLEFSEVPAGWFVVAILHDKDEDEELSMNRMGIPKEKYGFSQNPDSLWGPPTFDEAAVFLQAGERKQIVINIE